MEHVTAGEGSGGENVTGKVANLAGTNVTERSVKGDTSGI